MRTDSTNLSSLAVGEARKLVGSEYGDAFLPDAPRVYSSKVKNAQEAHEAIRPAARRSRCPRCSSRSSAPTSSRSSISSGNARSPARWPTPAAPDRRHDRGEGCVFTVSGKTIDFPGYLRAYVEGSDDPDAELADQEKALPSVEVGEKLDVLELLAKDHTTQPPGRFSEAALTKALEEKGIGRPSTYASIIDTILARNYVFKKGGALVPTWVAFSVVKLLEDHLTGLVDYQFTAQMEDDLDAISRGERNNLDYLKSFYFGNGKPGLKEQLENKVDEIDARQHQPDLARRGRRWRRGLRPRGAHSPFVEKGEKTASLPDELPPDEVKLDLRAGPCWPKPPRPRSRWARARRPARPVFLKVGRVRPYVMRGTPEDEEKPKNASLLKGMSPDDVDFETALKLLSLPRELGVHPKLEDVIHAYNGRYGPYVKCGSETRSLPADVSPLDVTIEQAIELLNQPKQRGRGRGAAKPPLKIYEEKSPVTEAPCRCSMAATAPT